MKILIIRLGFIGDVVLTTPVITALKLSYPDAELDFLVKKGYHELLIGNPHIRRVIPFDGTRHKGLKGLLEIAGELRKEGYTHVIDLHGNLRSRVISALISGSETLRYDKQAVKRRLLLLGFKVETKHTVDAYLTALNPIGINVGAGLKPAPAIYLSEEEEKRAGSLLAKLGISEDSTIIGFNPGARWQTKRWLEDLFIEAGKRAVVELGAKVVVFGGPDEVELSERVSAGIGRDAFSVAGKTGLRGAAALMKRCSVFVTNDSGPMHMATAVGTPVVAIFGPTVRGFGFYPLGKSVVVEKEVKCRPCSLHGSERCPRGHFECMKDVTVDDVMEAIGKMRDDVYSNF
ncbi:MAG: lipopolysaccharide heptosyltransferase II [Deltaproteobacteria bacterium]